MNCQRQRGLRQGGHVRRGKMLGEWRFHDGHSVLFSFLSFFFFFPFSPKLAFSQFLPPSFFLFLFCKVYRHLCCGHAATVARVSVSVLVQSSSRQPFFLFFFPAPKSPTSTQAFLQCMYVTSKYRRFRHRARRCGLPDAKGQGLERGPMSCMFSFFACMYMYDMCME